MENQLNRKIEDEFAIFLETFQKFIRVPSISGADAEKHDHPHKILAVLRETCEKWQLDLEIIENEVAEVSFGRGQQDIGVLLHLDVVPGGENWTEPPFSGKIVNDELWGRGTWDNKQPLVIFLFALYIFQKYGYKFKRRARLIMGTHEETGDWSDIRLYLKKKNAPDFCIVPDGSFPIGIAEKGFIDLTFKGQEIWKCPEFHVTSLKGGERSNMVPDKAELTIGFTENITDAQIEQWLSKISFPDSVLRPSMENDGDEIKLLFHGRSAHGSTPARGVNALVFAFRFLHLLCRHYKKELFPGMAFLETLTSDILGEKAGYAADDDFLGPTTGNVGLLNYENGTFEGIINLRPTIGTCCQDVVDKIRLGTENFFADKGPVQYSLTKAFKEPLYIDTKKNEQYLVPLREAYYTVTGREAVYIGTSGSTYAKAMPNSILFGPLDKDDGDVFHQPDEKVPLKTLKKNLRLYILALYRLLEPV